MEKKKHQYKKVGRLQNNARYTIDYDDKGKANVKWSYVTKDKKRTNFLFGFIIGLIILVACASVFSFVIVPYYQHVTLTECKGSFLGYNQSATNLSQIKYINITCTNSLNKTNNFILGYYPNIIQSGFKDADSSFKHSFIDQGLWILFAWVCLIFIVLIVFPLLIEKILVKEKSWLGRLNNKFNEREAKITGAKYKYIFREVPENNIIEIPVFQNRYLDYKTTGEFNKYLIKIEVKEHPFQEMIKKRLKGKMKRRWIRNMFVFYCKFYFSQNPTNGKLEVKWR